MELQRILQASSHGKPRGSTSLAYFLSGGRPSEERLMDVRPLRQKALTGRNP